MGESKLTHDDWQRLDFKFEAIHQRFTDEGSKLHKLDLRVGSLEQGSSHSCLAAIKAHNDESISHNPIKAIGFWAVVLGAIEIIKKLWPRL